MMDFIPPTYDNSEFRDTVQDMHENGTVHHDIRDIVVEIRDIAQEILNHLKNPSLNSEDL